MKRIKKSQNGLLERVRVGARAIRKRSKIVPEVAIILGTGLGNLTKRIKKESEIEYREIPFFPVSTVESHAGKLIMGTLAGKKVAVMEGRFHYYEGYSMQDVTFPVRVLKELGAKVLVVSNAAGGLNLSFRKGEIVLIDDHINLMGVNPLIGPNDERLGPRFPDMCAPYSERLKQIAEDAAGLEKLPVRRGVYAAVTGPNLETRAEYRMMRLMGADLVGMSTVPEVIVAVQMGMEVLGLSIVTDLCDPDHLEPVDIKEIIKTANEAGLKLDKLLEASVKKF
ncbi:MAG: purine-nucleoside phosphorylase [Candidatus Omnitrophica bacterium]|nr:purine-nucleoside phosphorylase [Candidatus Omnitrophota bacterium]MDD5671835.1 purine-nucleoside phosphorylase [Candidatus Omnitrophota bacterium]